MTRQKTWLNSFIHKLTHYLIKRKFDVLLLVFLAGLVICLTLAAFSAAAYSNGIQGEIASEVIRLHVIANSDSPKDQALKFQIRDAILAELSGWLVGDEDLVKTRTLLNSRITDIETVAAKYTHHPINVAITHDFFPTRTYEGITMPAGVYETLIVSIGEASGRNWWCVMFPPLCLISAVSEQQTPENETTALRDILSPEAYGVISQPESIRVKFKAVEIWQEIKNLFTKDS